jgi:STE24 endopeptidase
MPSSSVTLFFASFLLASLIVRLWLDNRQARHVAAHRATVPPAFAQDVSLHSHQRAADYTLDKLRFGLVSNLVGTAVLMAWTLLGGLDALNQAVREATVVRFGPLGYQLALLGAFGLVSAIVDLPLEAWSTFRIEQRHGFNRMTLGLWLGDQLKQAVVGLLIGGPIAALILWLMGAAGQVLVAVGLGQLGGLHPVAHGRLPHFHRAAVQQVLPPE